MAYGGHSAGSTWSRPWPGEPCRCRHRSSAGSSSRSAASRSSSLPAPVSSTASPAVACGTHTCSSPSPRRHPARKPSQAPVRSCTASCPPVRTSITWLSIGPSCTATPRSHGYRGVEMRPARSGSTMGSDPAPTPTRRTPVTSPQERPAIISDGLPSQLPDIDPAETAEWLESLDAVVDNAGPQPGALPDAEPAAAGPREAGRRARACAAPTTSTRSRPRASRGSPATSTSSAGSAPTSAGTRRSWCTGPSGPASGSAATSRPTPRRRACTRSASTTSSAARTTPAAATRSSSRATPPPACTPARSSRAG